MGKEAVSTPTGAPPPPTFFESLKTLNERSDSFFNWAIAIIGVALVGLYRAAAVTLRVLAVMLGATITGIQIICEKSAAWYAEKKKPMDERAFVKNAEKRFRASIPHNEQKYVESLVRFIADAKTQKRERKIPAEAVANCLVRLYSVYVTTRPYAAGTAAPQQELYRRLVRECGSIPFRPLKRDIIGAVVQNGAGDVALELLEDMLANGFDVLEKQHELFSRHVESGLMRRRRLRDGTSRADLQNAHYDVLSDTTTPVAAIFKKRRKAMEQRLARSQGAAAIEVAFAESERRFWEAYPFGMLPEQVFWASYPFGKLPEKKAATNA